MINDNEPVSLAELQAANATLKASLAKCQDMLAAYRDELAQAGEEPFLGLEDGARAPTR